MSAVVMNLLALDTCFSACSVAVRTGAGHGERRATRFEPMTSGHAECLFPMIEDVFSELAIGYDDLDALAVTIGPGSFTGTRLGIAAVRGLALATGLEVLGTTSLAAIASRALRHEGWPANPVLVCHDARRDQIYAQCFGGNLSAGLSAPAVIEAAGVPALLPPGRYTLVGTAAAAVEAAFRAGDRAISGHEVRVVDGDGLPDAEALLDVPLEPQVPPRPLYLRPPDAKPQAGHAIARA